MDSEHEVGLVPRVSSSVMIERVEMLLKPHTIRVKAV